MRKNSRCSGLLIFLLVMGIATPAYADTNVPMIAVTLPHMLIALIPICAVEWLVLRMRLKISAALGLKTALWANLASTFLGIPLAWITLVFVQLNLDGELYYHPKTAWGRLASLIFQAQAAFLPPCRLDLLPAYRFDLQWMIPAAEVILLIPFFFVSWWVEYAVARRMLHNVELSALNEAVFVANRWSYLLLGLGVSIYWLFQTRPDLL